MIHTECFMSGDPYKGAERTAGVRATQIYYSAWAGTVHMKWWHFGSMKLVYATKTKAPHWAKRLRYSKIMCRWEMKYIFTFNHAKSLNRVWQYWYRWKKFTHTIFFFYIYTQNPISISFHRKVPWKYGCHDNTTHCNWQYPVTNTYYKV